MGTYCFCCGAGPDSISYETVCVADGKLAPKVGSWCSCCMRHRCRKALRSQWHIKPWSVCDVYACHGVLVSHRGGFAARAPWACHGSSVRCESRGQTAAKVGSRVAYSGCKGRRCFQCWQRIQTKLSEVCDGHRLRKPVPSCQSLLAWQCCKTPCGSAKGCHSPLQWQQSLSANEPGIAEGWRERFEELWQLDQPDYAAFLFWHHAKARLCSQAFRRHCVERMHIVVRRPKPIPSGKCCCLGRFLIHLQNINIGFWWQLHVWDSLQQVLDGSSEQWTGLESKGLLRSGSDSASFPGSQGGWGSVPAIYEISRGEPCAECFWDPCSAGDTGVSQPRGLGSERLVERGRNGHCCS